MKPTKDFILTLLLFTDLEEYTGNIWAKTNMRKSFPPELFVPLVQLIISRLPKMELQSDKYRLVDSINVHYTRKSKLYRYVGG
jgi:hypothetical protein